MPYRFCSRLTCAQWQHRASAARSHTHSISDKTTLEGGHGIHWRGCATVDQWRENGVVIRCNVTCVYTLELVIMTDKPGTPAPVGDASHQFVILPIAEYAWSGMGGLPRAGNSRRADPRQRCWRRLRRQRRPAEMIYCRLQHSLLQ